MRSDRCLWQFDHDRTDRHGEHNRWNLSVLKEESIVRITSWLKNWSAAAVRRRGSEASRNRVLSQAAEHLECRSLPSANVLLIGTELNISLVRDDAVSISTVAGNVVVATGTTGGVLTPTLNLGSVNASAIQSIVITGGDEANDINLNGVLAADFTSLNSIVVDAGNGNDSLTGSPDFADSLFGEDGNDTILGQGGNDTLDGGDGADSIDGGTGDDTILGGDGTDRITGDVGNDSISAGNGSDSVDGGLGNDTIIGNNGEDTIDGGAGNDFLNGDGGADTIIGNIGDDSILGGELSDSLLGGDGNDTIDGQAGNDQIEGNLGNDNLSGGPGSDNMNGNEGNDVLNGQAGNDTAVGALGNDSILGGAGDDRLLGDGTGPASTETGNDTILGQSGNDTIVGGRGADTLQGGTGDDLVASAFIGQAAAPPPAPPPPPPPPPPVASGPIQNLDPAIAAGGGASLGNQATLTFGVGDGSLSVIVDGGGSFNSSTFDPIGAQYGPVNNCLFSDLTFRIGLTGTRNTLSVNATMTGTATEARSAFSQSGLDFSLVQATSQLNDEAGTRIGALLTQTYTITNPSGSPIIFDVLRYTDFHMFRYPTVTNDGGGRIRDPRNEEVYFESTNTIVPGSTNAFVGTTGIGGAPLTTDRFYLADLGIVIPFANNGAPLPDLIAGDTNGDDIVDVPTRDNRILIRNVFTIAPGASVDYTTHTAFGTIVPLPINVAPTALDDTATLDGTVDITFDVVSNDSDPDGAIDYTTIQIVTPPANGTVVDLNNGLLRYTPNVGFAGTDTFTYTIMDDSGAVSNVATVSISVTPGDVGSDLLTGDEGNDTLLANIGDDTLNGGIGDDFLDGGAGNDSELGGSGNDTLFGAEGDDTLSGQGGADSVDGGLGNDTVVWEGASSGNDFLSDTEGDNTLLVNGNGAANTFTLGQSVDRLLTVTDLGKAVTVGPNFTHVIIDSGNGNDTLNIGDVSKVQAIAVEVHGGAGNDTITGTGSPIGRVRLLLDGGDGNDTIRGTLGDDTIVGGAGNDNLKGGDGNDTISAQDGDDQVDGENGNDSIDGGVGADSVRGGAGNDSLAGSNDFDTLDGGIGNDTLDGGASVDSLIGGVGDDSLLGGLGADTLNGGDGNDTLDGGYNSDSISGGLGDDKIRGDHGNDTIDGGDGNDTINGGDGNDVITGGIGNDAIDGADGDDILNGSAGSDTLVGGDGKDTLKGGSGGDLILGEDGEDMIDGQGGTDTVAGGQGIDTIIDPPAEINEAFVLSASLRTILDAL